MLDLKDRKDLLFLLILGTLIVVSMMIFVIIMIWKPSKEKDRKLVVGQFPDNVNVEESDIVSEYINTLSELLSQENYDKLYELLSDDYKKYYNLDKNAMINKFKENKLAGQKVYDRSYSSINFGNYNKLYSIRIAGEKNYSECDINIFEKSPRQFTYSMDGFVYYSNEKKETTSDNLLIAINSKLYNNTSVKFNISLKNNSSSSMWINNQHYSDGILLTMNNKRIVKPTIPVCKNESFEIKSGEIVKFEVEYNISEYSIDDIYAITLRDVKVSENKVVNIDVTDLL